MPRGEGPQTKACYKGDTNDFVVLVESPEAVTRYRKDSSIPLVDVVNSFDVFVTNKHGAQGVMDRASKSQLENEFNTTRNEDVIEKILKDGKVEQTKSSPKFGSTNDARYGTIVS